MRRDKNGNVHFQSHAPERSRRSAYSPERIDEVASGLWRRLGSANIVNDWPDLPEDIKEHYRDLVVVTLELWAKSGPDE